MRSPSISSSSSTYASSAELFQIIPLEVIKSTGRMISTKDMEETSSEVAPPPTAEVVSDNVVVLGGSPTQSPPLQVMDRSSEAAHDPYKIPAAVFEASISMEDVDWSNASNDSLFSIRSGNASFPKDHQGNAWCRESVKTKRDLTLTPDRWSKSPSSPNEEVAAYDKVVKISEERKTISEVNPTVVEIQTKDYPIEVPEDAEKLNLHDKEDIGASPKDYSFPA